MLNVYLNDLSCITQVANEDVNVYMVTSQLKISNSAFIMINALLYPRGKHKKIIFSDKGILLTTNLGKLKVGFNDSTCAQRR